MKVLKVEMPYPGAVISVNHYKHSYWTKPEAKAWMEQLGWQIKTSHLEDWKLPLHIRCDGRFNNRRSTPDLSNLAKVILDAIEDVSGINDRDMRWQDGDTSIDGEQEPILILTISESAVWISHTEDDGFE